MPDRTDDAAATPIPRIGVFADIDDDTVERVMALSRADTVPVDTILIQQGERSEALWVILTGGVRVERDAGTGRHELAVLGAGAVVGEVSVLLGRPATATVTTLRETQVRRVAPSDVDALMALPVGERIRDLVEHRRAAQQAVEVDAVVIALADGTRVGLRPLWPDDWRLMAAGKDHVSHESLYRRFLSVPNLTEPLLRRLATIDYVHDFAWAVVSEDGSRSFAGARYARDRDDPSRAEMALLVGDDVQRHGIGRLLLLATAVAARAHGIAHLDGVLFRENRPVRALLDGVGAAFTPDEEPGLVRAELSPQQAIEAIDDPDLEGRIDALVRAVG